jgi:hypothetical protein
MMDVCTKPVIGCACTVWGEAQTLPVSGVLGREAAKNTRHKQYFLPVAFCPGRAKATGKKDEIYPAV